MNIKCSTFGFVVAVYNKGYSPPDKETLHAFCEYNLVIVQYCQKMF